MDRRDFIKVCGAGAAAVVAGTRAPLVYSGTAKDYAKVKLVDESGNPLKASSLSKDEAYVFGYPFAGTPCFLINLPGAAQAGASLKTETGEAYTFAGGVGPNKNIVAYLAVCTHQFAHPEKGASTEMSYSAGNSDTAGRAAVITCCAHNSAFDPANGASVVVGKASQPLPAVRLEHDAATDEIYATGMYGADLVEDFFKKFKSKLNKEFGIGKYRAEANGTVQAVLLSKYSTDIDHC
jgi:arsenite oxidase small subunit